MDESKLGDHDHLRTLQNEGETVPLLSFFCSDVKDQGEEKNLVDLNFSGQPSRAERCRVTYGNQTNEEVPSEGADIPIIRISPTFVDKREYCDIDTTNTNVHTSGTQKSTKQNNQEENGLQVQIASTTDNMLSHASGSHTLDGNGFDWTTYQISGTELPPLANGKEYHLFVSYSSEDRDRVFCIVTEIENKYKLKCVFDARDFQPGMRITDNIDNGIERSEKILVMLSDTFVQSNWCKHEVQVAFMRQMQGRVNSIIPVKLEDCAVPSTLANLTHIDARNISTADTADKIFKAYNRQVPEHEDPVISVQANTYNIGQWPLHLEQDQMPVQAISPVGQTGHVIQDMHTGNRGLNGFSMSFSATRQPLYQCRPAKYRFILTDLMMESLWRNDLFITVEDTCRTFRLLNSETAVQYAAWNTLQAVITASFLIITFFIIISVVIYCLLVICSSQPNQKLYYRYSFVAVILLMCGMFIFSVVVIALMLRRWKRKFNKALALLQKRLWNDITLQTIQQGILVLYSPSKVHPTSYLINYLKTTEDESVPENLEEFVTSQLTDLLERIYPKLAEHFDMLPQAKQVRHRVKQDRQCLYQMLEEQLFQ